MIQIQDMFFRIVMVVGKLNGAANGKLIGDISTGSYQRILRCANSSDANVNGIISQLGSMFEVDKYKINGGYPVLSWENGKYNK